MEKWERKVAGWANIFETAAAATKSRKTVLEIKITRRLDASGKKFWGNISFTIRIVSLHFNLRRTWTKESSRKLPVESATRAPPLSLILYIIEFYDAHKYENV